MPIQYQFDGAVLRLVVEGRYTWQEARDVLEEAMEDPAFIDGETVLLVTAEGSEYEPTYPELLEITRYMATVADRLGGIAVVATDPVHRTLAHMLASLVSYRDIGMEVFEDADAAAAWAAPRTRREKA